MLHRALSLLLVLAGLCPTVADSYEVADTVESSTGTLPLILTVPHDGGDFLGLTPARTKGAVVRDAGTRQLAERVASLLEQRLGRRPYLVIAKFSRKYADVNRTEADAIESEEALPAYREYHSRVADHVRQVRIAFPAGALLVDVHGQSDAPGTTFRGTRAGLTAKALVARFGPSAIQGDKSVIGVLASKGYAVHPSPGTDSLREGSRFTGGYTVFTYGSHRPEGIDAIQLEFGRDHRANPGLAEDLADALVTFLTQFEFLHKR